MRKLPDSQQLLLRPSTLPGLAYEIVPNTRVRYGTPRVFAVNRLGFRYRDIPQGKPSGVFRVFMLGDSVVFGQGTSQTDLSEELERLLNDRDPSGLGRKFEVVNTGVPSYTTCQELVLLNGRIDAFEPDLVVVGYAANDPEKPRVPFGLDLAKGSIPLWWRAYHGVKQRVIFVKWLMVKVSPLIVRLRGHAYYGPPVDPNEQVRYIQTLHDPKGSYWSDCLGCIDGFGAYQKGKKTPVLFVVFPMFNHLASPELKAVYRQVADAARRHGLDALSLDGAFRGLDKAALAKYRGDGMHPSDEGHVFAAQEVRRRLLKNPRLLSGRGRL